MLVGFQKQAWCADREKERSLMDTKADKDTQQGVGMIAAQAAENKICILSFHRL